MITVLTLKDWLFIGLVTFLAVGWVLFIGIPALWRALANLLKNDE